jgi:ceramide glucosyltransferase
MPIPLAYQQDAGEVPFWYSPRGMLIIFYILVLQQILQGLYSLWDGIGWLRMVRARLGSHAGFYAPQVAVICPCKGAELGLEDNLTALTRFDYPNYEIYISMATSLDPALKIIERVKAASKPRVHIVVAGPPENCGEKVNNLRKAVEKVGEKFEVFVFIDSDVRLGRNWLGKLVAPLGNGQLGAASTFRWFVPARRPGKSPFWSAVASVWNAAIVTLLGKPERNFCWGGGTAIRRQTFTDVAALEFWEGAVSDDWALTNALRQNGRPILFVPECLAPTPLAITAEELVEFTDRQMQITRVYDPRTWAMGAGTHLSYCVTTLYAACVILATFIDGDPWGQLALLALAIPLLSAMKGALRTIAILDLLPEWKDRLKEWSWAWILLAPFVPFLFGWNSIVAAISHKIRWRGIRYELVSPNQTRVLKR